MQLHSLSITAFGPFADTQHVDFDALAAGGLFLFHGPTGAGKTSVLDAVCFALYGQVPGGRAGSRSLRSDHAAPGVEPKVVLETTLRGRWFRLTRTATWERPKLRGSGLAVVHSGVHLEERHGDAWTTLSTRLDETGQLVGRLLGLTMTQFCQVVLLPQGQFAEFLRADADRRRVLLESLFDTQRFAGVERWLVGERQDSRRELEESDRRVSALLARVAEVAGAALPTDFDPDTSLAWADVLLDRARGQLAGAQDSLPASDTRRSATATALSSALRTQQHQHRHAALLQRRGALEQVAERRRAIGAEIDAARRVAPVVPMVAEVTRLDQSLALVSGEVLTRRALVADATFGVEVVAPNASVTAVRGQVDAAQTALGTLEQLAEVEQESLELAANIGRFEREVVALDQQRDKHGNWLAGAPERQRTLRAGVDAAVLAAARLGSLGAGVTELDGRLTAARRRDELDAAIAEAGQLLSQAVDHAQEARGRWLDLRAARIDGMAAELAATLHDGVPCPVCGSHTHPGPAAAVGEMVTRAQEDGAELELAAADRAKAAVVAGLATLRADRAVADSRAGQASTLLDLERELDGAQATLAAVNVVAAGHGDATKALTAFEAEAERRGSEQVRLDEQSRHLRAQTTAAADRLTRLQVRLRASLGSDPTVQSRAARLTALVTHLDQLAEALREAERLGADLSAAARRARVAAQRRGLAGIDDVLAQARDESAVHELETFRRRHDEELATVSELLGDPDLVAAAGAPPPDLPVFEAAAREADHLHTMLATELADVARQVEALDRLRGQLGSELAVRAPLAERHAVVDGLSRLAEGKSMDNRLRMSLSGYVLAARLEQVAAAASERLQRMSSGRYQLAHTTEGGSARERGGLHLRVLDAWTGADRDPATLSGGESFSASLALALGLADVVSQEAGGSLLETLFVDEGFGTLDDETLDEVMGVLDDLREGGRVVGLVSHVADLRQRIPVQLRVDKGRAGSTLHQ
jgi:DNA repair exonuclease SbcCD ATPase subunit